MTNNRHSNKRHSIHFPTCCAQKTISSILLSPQGQAALIDLNMTILVEQADNMTSREAVKAQYQSFKDYEEDFM